MTGSEIEAANEMMMSEPPGLRTYSAIRLFATLGLGIGLPVTVIMMLGGAMRPRGVHLPADLLLAVAFGATMTISFGTIHYYRSRAEARKSGFALPALRVPSTAQVLDVVVSVASPRATEMATRALQHLNPGGSITAGEPGKVKSLTPISLSSWGEWLVIEVKGIDAQRSMLRVSSRSRLWTNFLDFGKGLTNVSRLVSYLRDLDAWATKARNDPH